MTYNPAQSYLECGAYKFSFHSSNVFPGTFETVFEWWVIEISFILLAKKNISKSLICSVRSSSRNLKKKFFIRERPKKKFLNVQAAFYQLQYPISPIFAIQNGISFVQTECTFQSIKFPKNNHCLRRKKKHHKIHIVIVKNALTHQTNSTQYSWMEYHSNIEAHKNRFKKKRFQFRCCFFYLESFRWIELKFY